ncbi:MAG TPA: GNAT family N-acetyltransferase [Mucilaginibacter sp.]|jgi:GNAT superfamily N-acetyltransferase|nr:GNAT family N-acetyltransferase [Mucilaginibacter sp.]
MDISAAKVSLDEILPLRALFLQENNFQVRYNACHERGWSDSYLIKSDDKTIGYGSVKGKEDLSQRDAIFEFYLLPAFHSRASEIFRQLIRDSKAIFIECQSNSVLITSMLYEFGMKISSDVILFEDGPVTALDIPGAMFREWHEGDNVFKHSSEPEGSHVLEVGGEVVATGGFLLHYNKPFADLYMEVREDQRRKGYGSFLIQEVRKACYEASRIPAARCNISNKASKATLLKGGLKIAGYMLCGEIKG